MEIAGLALTVLVLVVAAAWSFSARGRARAARYCTKHVVKSLPGGPDSLHWVYGTHRTPGNECDGPAHQRAPWWW
jgi:hypothetical protein